MTASQPGAEPDPGDLPRGQTRPVGAGSEIGNAAKTRSRRLPVPRLAGDGFQIGQNQVAVVVVGDVLGGG
jgi:hypothetical protein